MNDELIRRIDKLIEAEVGYFVAWGELQEYLDDNMRQLPKLQPSVVIKTVPAKRLGTMRGLKEWLTSLMERERK